MAKETTIISEKMVDKVLATLKEMHEKSMEHEMKLNLERDGAREAAKELKCKEEKDMVKEEFARICKELKKTDPATEKYYQLSRNLQQIKNILGYWD